LSLSEMLCGAYHEECSCPAHRNRPSLRRRWRRFPPRFSIKFVRQGPRTPEEHDAAVRRFKHAIIERALGGELTHHLEEAESRRRR